MIRYSGERRLLEAVAKIDFDAADAADALDPRQFGLAVLQFAVRAVSLARDLLEVLLQRRARGIRRGHAGDLHAVMIVGDGRIRPWRSPADPVQAQEIGSAIRLGVMRRANSRVGDNTTKPQRRSGQFVPDAGNEIRRAASFARSKPKPSMSGNCRIETFRLSGLWESALL